MKLKFFEIKGFEGRYVMTSDASKVRSLPKKWFIGGALKVTPEKILKKGKDGRFNLRGVSEIKRLTVEQLLQLKGKEYVEEN